MSSLSKENDDFKDGLQCEMSAQDMTLLAHVVGYLID
jgi:hypothetical protein